MVLTGCHTELERFVQASTTTDAFVAQEIVKPKWLVCTPKLGPLFKISGFGSNHNAVGKTPNFAPQPVVPGK